MNIRKAVMADVPAILELVNGYAKAGLMLMKSPYQIYRNIQGFWVCELDGQVAGCCRLNVTWQNLAEISSLAVLSSFKRRGIGRALVNKAIEDGIALGITEFFTLTYQDAFFESCGFVSIEKDKLPHKVFGDCLMCPKIDNCDELAYYYQVSLPENTLQK